MKTILDTRFLDCENDDGTLRNKSREMKFELIMLPSDDDIEVTGGSVGTQINAAPSTGREDWLDMFVIPFTVTMSGCPGHSR